VATASPTAASTATALPGEGPNEIEQHGVAPSPNNGTGFLALKLKGSVDAVELRVYSKSMIMIGTSSLGHQAPGWCRIALPYELSLRTNGLYYYRVKAFRAGTSNREPGIGSFMVIK
jgi:hypothetical protein